MSRALRETIVLAGVIYPAGTPEQDVDGNVTADVWEGDSGARDQGTPASEGYSALKVGDLKAEIEKRNEGRDEAALLPTEGKKADLVAVLELDDAEGDGGR